MLLRLWTRRRRLIFCALVFALPASRLVLAFSTLSKSASSFKQPSTTASLLQSSLSKNNREQSHLPAAKKSLVSSYETFGDGALSSQTFAELYSSSSSKKLPDWLTTRCEECSWRYPTLVQQRSLDNILEGSDVVVQAQTGSGKTLSYLLPLIAKINASRSAIQALVIVPTRELGLQVARVAKRLAAASDQKIKVMSILQGSKHKRQRAWAWAEPPHVAIGTPEELTNMVRYGAIKYNAVNYVVVDEVDACLLNNAGSMTANLASSGPLHELLSRHLSPTFDVASDEDDLSIISTETNKRRPIARNRQTIFCSATIPQHRHFLRQCVQNKWTVQEPLYVCASPGELIPPTLKHAFVVCTSQERKLAALRRTISKLNPRKVLIFCEPHRPMEEMAMVLAKDLDGVYWKDGFGPEQENGKESVVSVLRYEDSLSKRASAMLGFQGSNTSIAGRTNEHLEDDKVRILFSTDLAARGLDVDGISHVIQFDLPSDGDTYVHRAGRAGRLGRPGMVVSLISEDQEFVLQRLANRLSLNLKCIARQKGKSKKSTNTGIMKHSRS